MSDKTSKTSKTSKNKITNLKGIHNQQVNNYSKNEIPNSKE